MQTSPRGRARVYCASRAEGLGCDLKGTFLDVYEDQIAWYLETFVIPEDYRQKILEAHKKLARAYDETKAEENRLKVGLKRLKQQYRWGHISRQEYLDEYRGMEDGLRQLSPPSAGTTSLIGWPTSCRASPRHGSRLVKNRGTGWQGCSSRK